MLRRRGFSVRGVLAAVVPLALVVGCGGGDDAGGDDDTGATGSASAVATTEAAVETSADTASTTAPPTDATPTTAGDDTATTDAVDTDPLTPQPLPEMTKLTIGWPGAYEVWSSVIVADALGELAAENLEVEFTTIQASEAIVLLETGRMDAFVSSITAGFFNAVANDANVRWAAPAFVPKPDTSEGLWVRTEFLDADGNLDVDRFNGTTLGIGSGGPAASIAPFVGEWLESNGLSIQDFEFGTFTGPDILLGLESGAVSAGWLSDPYWVEAANGDYAALQLPFPQNVALSGYILSGSLFDEDRAVGEAFVRALARTNRDHLAGDYHQNEAVVAAIAEAVGVEPATIEAGAGYVFPADLAFDTTVVTKLQEAWLQVGDILEFDEPLPVDAMVDTSLLDSGS